MHQSTTCELKTQFSISSPKCLPIIYFLFRILIPGLRFMWYEGYGHLEYDPVKSDSEDQRMGLSDIYRRLLRNFGIYLPIYTVPEPPIILMLRPLGVKIVQLFNKFVTTEFSLQDSPIRVHYQVHPFGPEAKHNCLF
jgi:hypothetical protein